MKTVLVDTHYWIAIINPKDQWHQKAVKFQKTYPQLRLVTTEAVLIETLNYFSSYGYQFRRISAQVIRTIIDNDTTIIIPQTETLFLAALSLYEKRLDKGYSMVDCLSMVVMKEQKIVEVLTHDKHFTQEGFTVLL